MAISKRSTEDFDADRLFEQLMSEGEGFVPEGFAEQVEKDLTGAGDLAVTRRLALVFLEKPFHETVETIKEDRAFAVSAAHMLDVISGHVQKYETLLSCIRAAQTRLMFAICAREDSDEILAEGKRETEAERVKRGWGLQ